MALPKFSELSSSMQILVILGLGVVLWGVLEFASLPEPLFSLQRARDSNAQKQAQIQQLERENAPLRPLESQLADLRSKNEQLQLQLENLLLIVPNEKEVDNFMRMVEGIAATSGIVVRRFTALEAVEQEFHIEVPFELELDGPYFDILQFYERLGRLARIINVSDLKMGSIEAQKSVGNRQYEYAPSETAVAVCTATTFFSREGESPQAAAGQPGGPASAGGPPRR